MIKMIEIRAEMIRSFPSVAKVSAWKERFYIDLSGRNTSFSGDRTLKIFISGNELIVDAGKGSMSPTMSAAYDIFIADIERIATKTYGYSDSLNARYTFK
ncbi:hypothetical protein V5G24_23555 [Xanthobacter sp. VTT E-85241]|uniref:hypothetical protein n=1 Tax=Roseixanthobacter finlandensis TaxID=3119922 RepID=UPI00372ABC60